MVFKKFQAYFNNFFWLSSTYLASPYLYLRILFRKKNGVDKILVIQTAKIGDLVCTTPVFHEIKKKYPGVHLAVLVTAKTKDIIKNNPRIDEIIVLDEFKGIRGRIGLIKKIRREKYDWAFAVLPDSFNNIIAFWSLIPNRIVATRTDVGELTRLTSLFNNWRVPYKRHASALKYYLETLKIIGVYNYSEEKEVFIRPEEDVAAYNFLKSHNLQESDLLVGMSVTSNVAFRQWELEKFAVLSDMLAERLGAKVILIGTDQDSAKNERVIGMMKSGAINTAGSFKLRELPAFLKKMKLFISMDTGPIYIANALGVPVVDIAAADDMGEQSPTGSKCRIVQKRLYCSPCIFVFSGIRYCKEGHLRCIKEITSEDVFQAAKELL